MTRSPTWRQQDYRFRADDGTMSAATYLASENTTANVQNTRNFRLRVNVGDTNNATTSNVTAWKLQFAVNGGTWTDVGASTAIKYVDSTYHTDGTADNAQRLTSVTGADAGWQVTWTEFIEDGVSASQTWTDDFTEYEFSLNANSVSIGNTITFRLVSVADGTALTPVNVPTASIVAVDNPLSVDSGAPTVAGSDITFNRAYNTTVTAASLTAQGTGQILENYANPGTVTIAGSDLGMEKVAGNTSVTLDSASLTAQGQSFSFDVTDTLDAGSPSLAGQDLTFSRGFTLTLDSASLSTTGSSFSFTLTDTLDTASLTAQGQAISFALTDSLDSGSLSAQGSSLSFALSDTLDSASLSVSGSTFSFTLVDTLDSGSATLAGSTITFSRGYSTDIVAASLSTTGSSFSFILTDTLDTSNLTIQGQDLVLSKSGVADTPVTVDGAALTSQGQAQSFALSETLDSGSLSATGQSFSFALVETLDAASLSVSGSTITLTPSVGYTLGVDAGSLTPSGTALILENYATAGTLTLAGGDLALEKIEGITIVVDPANLSVSGIEAIEDKVADAASLSVVGSEITFIDPTEIEYFDEALPLLYGSEIELVVGDNVDVSVDAASLTTQGQDVSFEYTPNLTTTVTAASLVVSGQEVETNPLTLESAQLSTSGSSVALDQTFKFEAASLEVTGSSVETAEPVTAAALSVSGSTDLTLVRAGNVTMNVTPAALTTQGRIIGQDIAVVKLSNYGRIDKNEEYIIWSQYGSVFMYPKDGGYYIISKEERTG